jgi:hypothetical protein
MRAVDSIAVLAAVGLIACGAILSARMPSKDCPRPSAQSVESLFAPCLEQQAARDLDRVAMQ